VIKEGDIVEYHEDGGVCECLVLKYVNDGKEESATLRVVAVYAHPCIGGPYVVGEEHSVWHRLDVGGFGGDWRIVA
jgi:hypothetical protein